MSIIGQNSLLNQYSPVFSLKNLTNGQTLAYDAVNHTFKNVPAGSGAGAGTVSSVSVSGGTTGLTTSGGPITYSGTIVLGGILGIANGGTGQTTATGAINALLPQQASNTGYFLTTNGSTVSWASFGASGVGTVTSVSVATANGVSGTVANSSTTPEITLSLGAITPTSVSTTGSVTGSNLSGTNTGDQTITLSGDITGSGTGSFATTLATVNSTPQTDTLRKITVNNKGLVTATSAVSSADIATSLGYTPLNLAGDTMTGLLILSGNPVNTLGAVTKQYADNIAANVIINANVRASTTATLATSSAGTVTYDNGLNGVGATLTTTGSYATIGGVAVNNADRILVKNEVTSSSNGIYVKTSNTVLTRAADADGSPATDIQAGDLLYVQEGTLSGTQWVQVTPGTISIGVSPIVFTQFAGAGTYTAGSGISIAANVVSNTGVTSVVAGTNISVSGATGAVTVNVTGTVPTATNIAGGLIGSVPYQSALNTTVLLAAGATGSVLKANGAAAPTWVAGTTTVGTTAIALGAASTTLAGLTSVTSTAFTGALTGNASTATSIAGGLAGNIHYQSAANTTALLTTGTSSQVLISGATPAWTNTPTLTGTNFTGIPNTGLTNSSVTVGSTAIALGSSATTLAGLTSVTSTTFVGALTGNSSTATTLATSRNISLTGDAAWTVAFNGASDATAALTLSTVNVSPQTDTFRKLTVNGKGLVTATSAVISTDITTALGYTPYNSTNPNGYAAGTVTAVSVATANGVSGTVANPSTTPAITLSLGAITPTSVAATGAVTGSNLSGTNTGDQTITLTGDVTGSGTGSFATALSNTTVVPGTYTLANITVNSKGRITSASNGSATGSTIRIITANDNILSTDNTILAYNTITLILPPAAANSGKEIQIKNAGGYITILPTGVDTIDSNTSMILQFTNSAIGVISDGTNWFIF